MFANPNSLRPRSVSDNQSHGNIPAGFFVKIETVDPWFSNQATFPPFSKVSTTPISQLSYADHGFQHYGYAKGSASLGDEVTVDSVQVSNARQHESYRSSLDGKYSIEGHQGLHVTRYNNIANTYNKSEVDFVDLEKELMPSDWGSNMPKLQIDKQLKRQNVELIEGEEEANYNGSPILPPLKRRAPAYDKGEGFDLLHQQFKGKNGIDKTQSNEHEQTTVIISPIATTDRFEVEGIRRAANGKRLCSVIDCPKYAQGGTKYCKRHGGGIRCKATGCAKFARYISNFCISHGGGKRCQVLSCLKAAVDATQLCRKHGGGKRCLFPGCTKGAEGKTNYCVGHGGGRRCEQFGCRRCAIGTSGFCSGHGGGKRCQSPSCPNGAVGPTDCCKKHGGGRRCHELSCPKSAQPPSPFCVRHGGGKRCKIPECTKHAIISGKFCREHGQ